MTSDPRSRVGLVLCLCGHGVSNPCSRTPRRRPPGAMGAEGTGAPAESGGLLTRAASRDQTGGGSLEMVLKLVPFVDPTEARCRTGKLRTTGSQFMSPAGTADPDEGRV